MKQLIFLATLFLITGSIPTAAAERFIEGTHYEIIDAPKSKQPEVVEYFSFYCTACFRFEAIAADLKSAFPNSFRKSHTSGLSPKGNMGAKMTQAYALALLSEKSDAFNRVVFNTNFVVRKQIDSVAKLTSALEEAGLSSTEINNGFNSFSVQAKARQMEKEALDRDVRGTPTLIINGKYKIDINGFRNSNNLSNDLIAAINMLLKK